ncbi:MAG: hypothetical protein GQ557_01165 [Mycoplasmataceae bacterium]|nr:hypothetical protein [Mycoplasmataceae bacterium]
MLKDYNIVTTTEINRKELNNNLFYYEDNKLIYDDHAIVPYYLYDGVKNVVQLERNNKLCMYKTTLHSAINLAIIEGYENIILFGIELEQDWSHFYGHNIKRPSKRLKKMRELLYMFTKYINIYKTNNNSLELEYIDIDSLI